jgi:hypothetical protein
MPRCICRIEEWSAVVDYASEERINVTLPTRPAPGVDHRRGRYVSECGRRNCAANHPLTDVNAGGAVSCLHVARADELGEMPAYRRVIGVGQRGRVELARRPALGYGKTAGQVSACGGLTSVASSLSASASSLALRIGGGSTSPPFLA